MGRSRWSWFILFILHFLLLTIGLLLGNPQLRLLHQQPQHVEVGPDLFVILNVAVRDQQLNLQKTASQRC